MSVINLIPTLLVVFFILGLSSACSTSTFNSGNSGGNSKGNSSGAIHCNASDLKSSDKEYCALRPYGGPYLEEYPHGRGTI